MDILFGKNSSNMKTKNQTTIFSTGVFLESVKCSIDGEKQWRWIAVNFEDESFLDGRAINSVEYADEEKKLIKLMGI